mmetsp:Transcript_33916/g.88988  ORF Transcript_33916/g.88988 Transcript_33916/m.88988 type:complete len:411 (-) Transcript_33916:88-1320(-)
MQRAVTRAAQRWLAAVGTHRAVGSHTPVVALAGAAHARTKATAAVPPKTAVMMMNMGGPAEPDETGPFLQRLFTDGDIIPLGPLQSILGNYIAKRRTPKVQAQYEEIGGSPIRKWTTQQGDEMCRLLDQMRPESAPHKAYTAFRYAHPLSEEALAEMDADGVERVIAFSQYPQWSCTTTGSSMNELWRQLKALKMEDRFQWSIIDRWHSHPGYHAAVVGRIKEAYEQFAPEDRDKVQLLFSAHSVPMKVVNKGDHYVGEVAASVHGVMRAIADDVKAGEFAASAVPKHVLCWQSKVGFLPWMVPQTSAAIEALGKRSARHVLVVPIAFTSDHIETLYEIGIEYAEEAEEVGITHFKHTEGLNDSSIFSQTLADIVADHLDSGTLYSPQYKMKCLGCTKPLCRSIINPATV